MNDDADKFPAACRLSISKSYHNTYMRWQLLCQTVVVFGFKQFRIPEKACPDRLLAGLSSSVPQYLLNERCSLFEAAFFIISSRDAGPGKRMKKITVHPA